MIECADPMMPVRISEGPADGYGENRDIAVEDGAIRPVARIHQHPAASIRHTMHCTYAAMAGADIIYLTGCSL